MPGTYYAAVEDDPLTSGKGSRVFSALPCGAIEGEDGKRRRLAFIGDKAYCPACDSFGQITYGAGVSGEHRLIDQENGGRHQAVGGDIVSCKCSDHPRIISVYGRSWMIHDQGEEKPAQAARAPVQILTYDQQFTVTDAAGKALAKTWYTVRMPSGDLLHGVTDSSGKTARYKTDSAQRLALYLGHRENA